MLRRMVFGLLLAAAMSLGDIPKDACPAFARNVQRMVISGQPRMYAEFWRRAWPNDALVIDLAQQMALMLRERTDAGDKAYQACMQASRDIPS